MFAEGLKIPLELYVSVCFLEPTERSGWQNLTKREVA